MNSGFFDFPFELLVLAEVTMALIVTPLMTIYVTRYPKDVPRLSFQTSIFQFIIATTVFGAIFGRALMNLILKNTTLLDHKAYQILIGSIIAATVIWTYLSIRHMNTLKKIYWTALDDLPVKSVIAPCKEMIGDATARGTNPCWATIIVAPIGYFIEICDVIEGFREYFLAVFALSLTGVALGNTIRLMSDAYIFSIYFEGVGYISASIPPKMSSQ